MRKFIFILLPLFFLHLPIKGQGLNVTRLARWGKGRCEAVFRRGGYTFIGNGGYLEVYKNKSNSYDLLNAILMPGPVKDIWVQNDTTYIYVVCGDEGLQIVEFDKSNEEFVGIISELDTPGYANGIIQRGKVAYIADGNNGMLIIDVRNLSNPQKRGTFSTSGFAREVWAANDSTVYVAADTAGLYSIHTGDRNNPVFLDSLHFSTAFPGLPQASIPATFHVITIDTIAYVAAGWGGMRTVDIRDPANLIELGIWTYSGIEIEVLNVWVSGNYAYLACGIDGIFSPVDITDPSNPKEPKYIPLNTDGYSSVIIVDNDTIFVGDSYGGHLLVDAQYQPVIFNTVKTADMSYDVITSNQYGYIATGKTGVKIFDLSKIDTTSNYLNEVSSYDTQGEARNMTKSGSFLYVADGSKGLTIIDASNPKKLSFWGEFIIQEDTCYDVDVPPGNYAYLACGSEGLNVVNIGGQIFKVGGVNTPGSARAVKVVNDTAYVADLNGGVLVYDVSNPSGITLIDSYNDDVQAMGIDVIDNTVFVANGEHGFLLWDVSTDSLYRVETSGICTDIVVKENTIYIADSQNGFRIFDYSNPGYFPEVGYYDTGGRANGVAIYGEKVLVADGEDGVYVLKSAIQPMISLSARTLNFGPVPPNYSRQLWVWVTNEGTSLLNVSGIEGNREDVFKFQENSFSVAPGDTHRLVVSFEPTISYVGSVIGNANIFNNADTIPLNLGLQGKSVTLITDGPYNIDNFTVGLWHFDENDGVTNVTDASANNLGGQILDEVIRTSNSKFSRGLRFTGQQNSRVEIPYNNLLNFRNSPFTIDLWFRMINKPESYSILLKRGIGNTLQYEIALASETVPETGVMARVRDENGNVYTLNTGSMDDMNTEQWYHTAFSWDQDSLRLYLNGVLKATKRLRRNLFDENSEILTLGASSQGNAPFEGYIDELRISNIARLPWEFHVNKSRLVLEETEIDFGDVLLGYSRRVSLQIKNGGSQSLVVSSISTTDTLVEVTHSSGFTLVMDKDTTVWLTFTPESESSLGEVCNLIIESSDPTYPSYSVPLRGSGVTSFPAGSYSTDAFTLGLWHFDETTGNVVNDESYYKRYGALKGGVTLDDSKKQFESGRSLYFDGQNGVCIINSEGGYRVWPKFGGFTVECWFLLEDALPQGKGVLVRRGSDAMFQFDLSVDGTTIVGRVFNTEMDSFKVTSSPMQEEIQIDQWYHVSLALDEDTLQLNINGNEIDSKSFTGRLAGTEKGNVDTLSILVGRDWGGAAPFYGNIDELRISGIGRQLWEYSVEMARIEVSSSQIDFGEVFKESERTLKLWVRNYGMEELEVDSISSSDPSIFQWDIDSFNVSVGDSQLVRITYSPKETIVYSGELVLDTNDPFHPSFSIILGGIGIDTRTTGAYESDPFTSALYHFNEGSGTAIGDSSGEGLHGIIMGNIVWSDSGRFGKSLHFDGVDDRIEISYDPLLDFTNSDFTIELWFSVMEKPANYYVLMSRGRSDTSQFELILHNKYGLRGNVWDFEGTQYSIQTGSLDELNLNQWYHAALSWNGDSLCLYLNDVLRDTELLSGSLQILDADSLIIGADFEGGFPFQGYLDEIRISNIERKAWEFNVAPPKIKLTPGSLNFATVLVNQSRTLRFWIQNMGDQDLVVTNFTGIGEVFTLSDTVTSFTLSRLGIQMIPITYTPSVANTTHKRNLIIISNDADNPTMIFLLEGSSSESRKMKPYSSDSHTIALYHFNELTGDTVVDASDWGHTGILKNGVTRTVNGFFGRGLLFDGIDDLVEIQSDTLLTFDMVEESFTIECFFRTDTVSQALIFKGFEDTSHVIDYGLTLNDEGRLGVEGFEIGGPRLGDGAWHHTAFSYNHITQNGKFYIDGIQMWSRLWIDAIGNTGERPLVLGAAEQSAGQFFRYFEGYLDEVRISDIVREPWEFQLVDYGIEVFSLTPDTPLVENSLTLNINIPIGLNARGLAAHYRAGGSDGYQVVTGDSLNDSTYQVIFPGEAITLRGLEYFFEILTENDTLTYPVLDPENNPMCIVVRHSGMNAPIKFSYKGFQMFSVPFQLDKANVKDVLVDDLGEYDPYQWRLFWWHRLDSVYKEYNQVPEEIFELNPGRAFWVVTMFEHSFDIGNGKTVSTDSSYQIKIEPGWNMVGNPFNFTVRWDVCSLTSDSISTLYYWQQDSSLYRLDWQKMEPWKGYWIYNADTISAVLSISPRQDGLGKESSMKRGVLYNLSEEEWLFRISVETGDTKDPDNFAGVRINAKDEWDTKDRPEAPPIGNYTNLYFDNRHWKRHAGTYAADVRSAGKDGYIWEFVVESNTPNQSAGLNWKLYQNLPEKWEAYLFDLYEGFSKNLLIDKSISFETGKEVPWYRRFRLVVGTKEFIENHNEEIPLEPVRFALYQNYPNPFNPETKIKYSLPKRSDVEIIIYNAVGQRVCILLRERKNAGYHEIIWNGRNDEGRPVSSGVYLYKLRTSDMLATRKMVVLR